MNHSSRKNWHYEDDCHRSEDNSKDRYRCNEKYSSRKEYSDDHRDSYRSDRTRQRGRSQERRQYYREREHSREPTNPRERRRSRERSCSRERNYHDYSSYKTDRNYRDYPSYSDKRNPSYSDKRNPSSSSHPYKRYESSKDHFQREYSERETESIQKDWPRATSLFDNDKHSFHDNNSDNPNFKANRVTNIQNCHFEWILTEDPVLDSSVPQNKYEYFTCTTVTTDPRRFNNCIEAENSIQTKRSHKLKETLFEIDDSCCPTNLPPSIIYCKGLRQEMTKIQVYSLFEDFSIPIKSVELLINVETRKFEGKASIEFQERLCPIKFDQIKKGLQERKSGIEIFYDVDRGYWDRSKRKLKEELAKKRATTSTSYGRGLNGEEKSNERGGWNQHSDMNSSGSIGEGWQDPHSSCSKDSFKRDSGVSNWHQNNKVPSIHCLRLEGIRNISTNDLKHSFQPNQIKSIFVINNCIHIEFESKSHCDQIIVSLNDSFIMGHKLALSYVQFNQKDRENFVDLSNSTSITVPSLNNKDRVAERNTSRHSPQDSWNFFEKSKSLFSSEEFSKIVKEISQISYNPTNYEPKRTDKEEVDEVKPESPPLKEPSAGPSSRHLPYKVAKEYFCSSKPPSLILDTSDDKRQRISTLKFMIESQSSSQQLALRTKRLKLAKSSIHAMGIFAMEPIESQSFVIEYIGELVRNHVADLREKFLYEKYRDASSYLFRLDREQVVDATTKGNLSRFMNHSCDPTCTARIINLNGRKRICIYARKDISIGQEITYDYKFPIEAIKIPCFCGATNCRGTLN